MSAGALSHSTGLMTSQREWQVSGGTDMPFSSPTLPLEPGFQGGREGSAVAWPSKPRKGGRSCWLLGYLTPPFMGSGANGHKNSSSVLLLKADRLGTRMSLLPLNSHALPPSMGQRLGSRWRRSIRNPRLISKSVFFWGVHRRVLNVLCKCSNICFGFWWVNRRKETVHYVAVKRGAFLKHFFIPAEGKESSLTQKCLNASFMRSLRILQ